MGISSGDNRPTGSYRSADRKPAPEVERSRISRAWPSFVFSLRAQIAALPTVHTLPARRVIGSFKFYGRFLRRAYNERVKIENFSKFVDENNVWNQRHEVQEFN